MTPDDLKIGDRIRIIAMPGEGVLGYYMHRDTRRVFKKLIARGRSVRIDRIEWDLPWYTCRFRMKNGKWEGHFLAVCVGDNNWVMVKPRRKKM